MSDYSYVLLIDICDLQCAFFEFKQTMTHYCSNPGYPFSTGITLAKLAAVTMDDQGNETFDTSGALDKLRKVNILFIFFLIGTSFFGFSFF